MSVDLFFVFLFGLIWGSFLNVVGSRLVSGESIFTLRSRCPECSKIISWYDNIPVISWILLKGRCRNCKKPISFLYPIIELFTAFLILFLYKKYYLGYSVLYEYFAANYDIVGFDKYFADMVNKFSHKSHFSFPVFFVFLSALIVSVRTDLQAMVIPQICTLWLVPLGFISSYFGLTSISVCQSLEGAFFGYAFLWVIAFLFKKFTGKEGVGVGDMELLAMIGSFLGPLGVWVSLMFGSVFGLIVGSLYLFLFKKNRMTQIPFGPFLALSAIAYFFFDQKILQFLF